MSNRSVERLGWRSAHLVAVDVETTGLDPVKDEMIAFAAVPIRDGRVIPGEVVNLLVHPERPSNPEAIRIHGLRRADLEHQPRLHEQIEQINDAIADSVVVAHSAWIEMCFLDAALYRYGHTFEVPVIDTMVLGPIVLRSVGIRCPDSPSLSFLARALNLPVHRPHHADGDALTTAQVFLALASRFSENRTATIADLAYAGRIWNRMARLVRKFAASQTGPRTGPEPHPLAR